MTRAMHPGASAILLGGSQLIEEITLSPDGNHYSGTFTLDAYDPSGNQVAHIVGVLTATRVNINTKVKLVQRWSSGRTRSGLPLVVYWSSSEDYGLGKEDPMGCWLAAEERRRARNMVLAATFASPKSRILAWPRPVTKMLAGLSPDERFLRRVQHREHPQFRRQQKELSRCPQDAPQCDASA
jgi:hypothetical protein